MSADKSLLRPPSAKAVARVELKDGEHFTRTRKRIRAALIEDGVAGRIEALVARLIGVTPVATMADAPKAPEDDDAD